MASFDVKTVNAIINSANFYTNRYLIYSTPENPVDEEILINSSNKLWKIFDDELKPSMKNSRSYKLWAAYTDKRSGYVLSQLSKNKEAIAAANETYERALQVLYLCPRLWINYLDFLGRQKRVVLLRKTFNRAIQSLPILQHDKIWDSYLPIVRNTNCIPTISDAYRRYVIIHPEFIEDAASWFISNSSLKDEPCKGHCEAASKEAAYYLKKILNDPNFVSTKQRPKYFYWSKLAEVIMANPNIEGAEEMLRSGCEDFVVETGRVWTTIADHYSRMGLFADTLQVYEDALSQTRTAHDFSIIFESATSFISHVAEYVPELADNFMGRLEDLLDRREILLNATLLREDPNNVIEWINKALLYQKWNKEYFYEPKKYVELFTQIDELFDDSNVKQLNILMEAIETVKPKYAFGGNASDLWISLATLSSSPSTVFDIVLYHSESNEITTSKQPFLSNDDLVRIYIYYAEMRIKEGKIEMAQEVMSRAIDNKSTTRSPEMSRVWSLALDIEWSFGKIASTRALFERCMASDSATPLHVVAYTTFLKECGHKDDMFRVYERGIAATGWPNNGPLWVRYLNEFVETYGGTKRERARDLFEEALKGEKSEYSKYIYILYAQFEEKYGIFKHAMNIYRRAADELNDDEVYHVWIASTMSIFGASKCREVYEYAISKTSGETAALWCSRYAKMEAKLTEYQRARDIFLHGAQFANPEKLPDYWQQFEEFENAHGTKDTFAEMLSQKNLATQKFNNSIHIGMINEENEDEDKVLDEIENARLLSVQEQMIPKTIFDNGINANSTINEIFAKKKIKRNLN